MDEPKNYLAIMLSSTFTDLREHRQRAIEAISKLGYMPRVMEHSGAQADADVIETSLKMVRDSAAYVGVISQKYGQTPFDPDRNPNRLSITELEFNEAMRLDRPIVLFVMGDEHPVKKADVEADPKKKKKLDEFRERAKRMRAGHEAQRVYEVFDSLDQFSAAAAIAIGNLVRLIERSAQQEPAQVERRPAQALSNVPINVPRHFLGRDDDIAAIEAALKIGDGRAAITALHGLRGVGKTTLAAAYAERCRQNYRATWWIRAETESTMRADLVGLGVRLGWVSADAPEEPALAAVLERLRDDGDGILLVYDNAISPDEIRNYLPRGGAARIIVTSNAPNWDGIAARVEIEVWPPEIGAEYLIARTGRESERNSALPLSEALGGQPLAHEQATAYCSRTGLSLADYRKKFEVEPTRFLDAEKDASPGYHNRRTAAKALAIDEAAKIHNAAEPLIVYASLLAPEPIPLFLFSEAPASFSASFSSAIADNGLDEAVAALRAFALVDREDIPDERDADTKTDCIRLHRLVRQVAASRRRGAALETERLDLIRAMAAAYPINTFHEHKSWPRMRRLDALALALADAPLIEGAEKETSYLLDRLASYRQSALAAYAQARPLYERALAIDESVSGPEGPAIAPSLVNLAHLMILQKDFGAAKPLLQRALAIDETTFGPDHPEVATDLDNLGGLLESQGDSTGARRYFERALAIREKALGPDHPDTALSLNNVGGVLDSLGDFVGARSHYERALAIREEELGSDHPDTANSFNNLGYLLRSQGDFTGARAYYERALAIVEVALGPAHPTTKTIARNTLVVLDALERAEEAKSLRQKFDIKD